MHPDCKSLCEVCLESLNHRSSGLELLIPCIHCRLSKAFLEGLVEMHTSEGNAWQAQTQQVRTKTGHLQLVKPVDTHTLQKQTNICAERICF